jgi:hypothetical protein
MPHVVGRARWTRRPSAARARALLVALGAAGALVGGADAASARAAKAPARAPAFAPYVDMSLYPAFAMGAAVRSGGVRAATLAFIVSGAPCEASWGTYYGLDDPYVTAPLAALRAAGGQAIVSFGGAANQELAQTCPSVDALVAQYQSVIDRYRVRDLDFDVEGAAQADTASLTRRAQAITRLQAAGRAAGKPVRVSFTLPVMPTGLTADGLNVLRSAIAGGVDIGVVNLMAMDYFDPALSPAGRMGDYAIQAARSTHRQLARLYPRRSGAARWRMVGITPMLGINDNPAEIFTTADATKLVAFAQAKRLGRLSMWSANRDAPCPAPSAVTQNTCSGVADPAWAFSRVFGAVGR